MAKPKSYRPTITVDQVNHPPHYQFANFEVIQLTEQLNFNRGNAVKYTARAGRKDPAAEIEDLEKAVWYLNREIQRIRAGVKAEQDAGTSGLEIV